MKYQVIYYKNKKNKTTKQTAVFYTIEDATLWEEYIQNQGYLNSEIIPLF